MAREVVKMRREVAALLLEISRNIHPNEMIVLLHGRREKTSYFVEEISFPPQSIYGESFSSFNPYQLPIDHSFLGVAHSHPSGAPHPSVEDLNNMMGELMVIVTAPYRDERDIHVLDGEGRRLTLMIV